MTLKQSSSKLQRFIAGMIVLVATLGLATQLWFQNLSETSLNLGQSYAQEQQLLASIKSQFLKTQHLVHDTCHRYLNNQAVPDEQSLSLQWQDIKAALDRLEAHDQAHASKDESKAFRDAWPVFERHALDLIKTSRQLSQLRLLRQRRLDQDLEQWQRTQSLINKIEVEYLIAAQAKNQTGDLIYLSKLRDQWRRLFALRLSIENTQGQAELKEQGQVLKASLPAIDQQQGNLHKVLDALKDRQSFRQELIKCAASLKESLPLSLNTKTQERLSLASIELAMTTLENLSRQAEAQLEARIGIAETLFVLSQRDLDSRLTNSGRFLFFTILMATLAIFMIGQPLTLEAPILERESSEPAPAKPTSSKSASEDTFKLSSEQLKTLRHDLRNNINGVLGMVELLRETALDDKQRRCVNLAFESSKTMLAKVNTSLVIGGGAALTTINKGVPSLQAQNSTTVETFVLVAGADSKLRAMTDDLITDASIHWSFADNAQEALKTFAQRSFSAVLLSTELPGMVDLDVAESIRKDSQSLLIITTEDTRSSIRERCDKLDARLLYKPFEKAELQRLLEPALVSQSPQSSQAADPASDKSSSTQQYQYFSPAAVQDVTMGDAAFTKELLESLVKDFQGFEEQCRELLKQQDRKALDAQAHTMKSLAQTVAAEALTADILKLREQLPEASWEEIEATIKALWQSYESMAKDIERYLSTLD